MRGKLDFNRVGLLGHSRGGDGAIAFLRLNDGKKTGRFNVRAVMPVASTHSPL